MNFEFLKNLSGFGYVYENCCNAEKLAVTMPVQSVFTSRKSAEVLAKFIYMAAHNQKAGEMKFSDILRDDIFRRYIDSREIMNAFQHIRMSGNTAVHDEVCELPVKEAVTVLQDLHFVTGETARMMGLIDRYPRFDRKISAYPDARYIEEGEVEKKAQKMFLEYVEKYDAQVERERFYKRKVDKLREEFAEACSPFQWNVSIIHSHELIESAGKLLYPETVRLIQDHFGYLGMQTVRFLTGEFKEDRVYNFDCRLTVFGENGYTTSDLGEFIHGILYDLPEAEGFRIETFYDGPNYDPGENNGIREFFEEAITKTDPDEEFVYKIFERTDIDGESWCGKYEKGKWTDLESQYSPEVVNRNFESKWESDNHLQLEIGMDIEKYPEIFSALNDITGMYFSEDELKYLEDVREDEGIDSMLLYGVDWYVNSMREVQEYLDELNRVLAPVMSECKGFCDGKWYLSEESETFGVATWEWTEKGFRITGTVF